MSRERVPGFSFFTDGCPELNETQSAFLVGIPVAILMLLVCALGFCAMTSCKHWEFYSGVQEKTVPTNPMRWQGANVTPGPNPTVAREGAVQRTRNLLQRWD